MPRYEFSEGSSNKFWEINLNGKAFTTTYGKIGTSGQTSIKTWKDNAEAKKEYDKLVAEKTKKGYKPAGGNGAAAAADDDDDDDAPAPKKKAAAAPAKKAAAPAKAAAKGGGSKTPRYFEFSEGSSNKFWEVSVEGTVLKTRYGKIGAAGSTTVKDYGTAEKVQKEYDKIVAEKTKKGYEETTPSGGGDDDEDDDD
jgi:predicted DNA-binding WGR domain protein